ncbi:MAG: hypothetical protein AVDCRST_MAG35-2854, partial [uncultured Quadrisphaera sp.]
ERIYTAQRGARGVEVAPVRRVV